jgi:hypothetical protein
MPELAILIENRKSRCQRPMIARQRSNDDNQQHHR